MPIFLTVALLSLVISISLVLTKNWHGRFSMDHTEGVQKFHTQPTPRIGGIGIFVSLLIAWRYGGQAENAVLAPLLLASLPAFLFGLLEDLTKRVGVVPRLFATMASGVVACFITGVAVNRADVPLLDEILKYWPFAVAFTAFAVAGIANAVNIIDGFNGLSSGAAMIILAAFGVIAQKHGDVVLAANCVLLGAAILGFWFVNFPFGKLFLGDGGAYFVGFALGWLGLLLTVRNPAVSPWVVVLACAYPVIEVLYSMWRRFASKRSASAPDSLHMHSVVKKQFVLVRFAHWPADMRNAAVSPIMWLCAACPAVSAVFLSSAPVWILVLANLMALILYHCLYRRLIRVRDTNSTMVDSR
jgi:UDP-N-acetylmuramyl pentapeptide phosphotransferase/UDP-N-acetylglucosamine-1-phosphate transferase